MTGVLAIWTDIEPATEADFNDWYNHQHLAERSAVPGFHNGRRFRALSGSPRYLAIYHTDSPQVLFSNAYQARLEQPTPWTQRIIPQFRHVTRGVFTVAHRLGQGSGGVVATLRFVIPVAQEQALQSGLTKTALPQIIRQPGIVGAQIWRPEQGESSAATAEGQLRQAWNSETPWVICLEANSATDIRAACKNHLSRADLQRQGARQVRSGVYRLLYSLGHYPFEAS